MNECTEIQFVLTLDDDGDQIWCEAAHGARTFRDSCGSASQLAQMAADAFSTFKETGIPPETMRDLGTAVAAALLPNLVTSAVDATVMRNKASKVRLGLRLPDALNTIPWEIAHVDTFSHLLDRPNFLALSPCIHFLRLTSPPEQPSELALYNQDLTDRLVVLIVWADPQSGQYAHLTQARKEARDIEAILHASPECRRIETRVLANATPAMLEAALAEFQPDVLHFIGHAEPATSLAPAAIILKSDTGYARLHAGNLQPMLQFPRLKLVILNACDTIGLGAELSRQISASILCHQSPLREVSVRQFSRALYGALTCQDTLEQAVSGARTAIEGHGADWVAPVLFASSHSSSQTWMARGDAMQVLPFPHSGEFNGREADIQALHFETTAGRATRAVIFGISGIGKTMLASQYAHAARDKYPGGTFWVRAANEDSIKSSFSEIADLLHIPESLANREHEALRILQRGTQKTLFIYDNVTDSTPEAWLPVANICTVLATCRSAHLPSGFRPICLDALDEEGASALLQSRRSAITAQDSAAVLEITKIIGNLPLALTLAAHHVARLDIPFSQYLQILRAEPVKTLTRARTRFTSVTGHSGSLFDSIDIAIKSLGHKTRRMLLATGCFAEEPIPVDLLQQSSGEKSTDNALDQIAYLRDGALLKKTDQGYVALHELVRQYLRHSASSKTLKAATARAAKAITEALRQGIEAARWQYCFSLLPHAAEITNQCRKHKLWDEAVEMLIASAEVRQSMADYDSALRDLDGAEQLLDCMGETSSLRRADLLVQKGDNIREKNDSDEQVQNYFHEALRMAERSVPADSHELGRFFNACGAVASKECAIGWYQKGLSVLLGQEGSVLRTRASIHNNMGTTYEDLAMYEDALKCLNLALDVEEQKKNPRLQRIASMLDNKGRCLTATGNLNAALVCHNTALQMRCGSIGERHLHCAASHYYIAENQRLLGNTESALQHYSTSQDIYLKYLPPSDDRPKKVRGKIEELIHLK